MSEFSITSKINEDFKRRLVDCINMALHDNLPRYLAEFHPETTNGVPHQINDWINTNITTHLTNGNIDTITFARHSWQGKIVVDTENYIAYSIMRGKRVRQLRHEKRERPHYLQTVIAVLNNKFTAGNKQITMFDMEKVFDEEIINSDYDTIMQGRINSNEGYIHCVIAYETERNEIVDIRILFLDKDFDEIDQISLNDYVKPDFAKLTSVESTEQISDEDREAPNVDLLTLKKGNAINLRAKNEKRQA